MGRQGSTFDRPRAYDPSEDSAILIGIGAAHAVADPAAEREHPAGRLVVPDPDTVRGWRDYYVPKGPRAESVAPRPLGFRPR